MERRSLATSAEVAAYLQVPQRTLSQWRYLGKGPRFRTVGRYVRYAWTDVERWYDAQQGGGDSVAS